MSNETVHIEPDEDPAIKLEEPQEPAKLGPGKYDRSRMKNKKAKLLFDVSEDFITKAIDTSIAQEEEKIRIASKRLAYFQNLKEIHQKQMGSN